MMRQNRRFCTITTVFIAALCCDNFANPTDSSVVILDVGNPDGDIPERGQQNFHQAAWAAAATALASTPPRTRQQAPSTQASRAPRTTTTTQSNRESAEKLGDSNLPVSYARDRLITRFGGLTFRRPDLDDLPITVMLKLIPIKIQDLVY